MTYFSKLFRAVTFNETFYKGLEYDRSNIYYAMLTVALVGLCNGIGTMNVGSASILKEVVFNIMGWFIWSFIIYLIGVRIINFSSDLVELLVYLGFAFSPGIINILGIIPQISYHVLTISIIWTILTFIYAVKYALNCSYSKAAFVSIISVIPYIIIRSLLLVI